MAHARTQNRTPHVHQVISCQYIGCCGHTGSIHYFLERLVTVGIGCVLPVILAQAFAPWYLSVWATNELAGSFVAAMQVGSMYL